MRMVVGSDEQSALTDSVVEDLIQRGVIVELVGALREGDDPRWPNVALQVAESVAMGKCDEGILMCWTGTGVSIAANKIPGIRAALCQDAHTAMGARRWNRANILVMGLRLTSEWVAREILEAWFQTPLGEGDDAKDVELLYQIEKSYLGIHSP